MLYLDRMRKLDDLGLARAATRVAKRNLDIAHLNYVDSVAKLEALIEDIRELRLETEATKKPIREPKGRVRELVKLAFTTGDLGRSPFSIIFERIQILAGHDLSEATVRQTLYRMEKLGELERYSGYWSIGNQLQRKP